jgi:hypothetical protein
MPDQVKLENSSALVKAKVERISTKDTGSRLDVAIELNGGRLAERASLRCVHARPRDNLFVVLVDEGPRKDDAKWATVAVEVVTAVHAADHRRGVVVPRVHGRRHGMLVAGDGVPNDEAPEGIDVEQRAPVTAFDSPPVAAVKRRRGEGGGGGCGDESNEGVSVVEVVEEAE